MKIEKVEIIRVRITETLYCEVMTTAEFTKEFWLKSTEYAKAVYMFGCNCCDEEVTELILANYKDYLEDLYEK